MQTGRQDLVNYAGSWYLENPRMAAALEFAGNDVKIELGEDGHSNRHGASMLPDTLRWLWRDYPQPVTVGERAARRGPRDLRAARAASRGDRRRRRIRRRRRRPQAAPRRPRDAAGGPRGAVYALIYRDKLMGAGRRHLSSRRPVRRWTRTATSSSPIRRATGSTSRTPARTVTVFKENTGGARALRVGADGRLYATQPAGKRLVSYGPGGDEKVVAQNIQANDLALTRSGAHLLRRHGAEDRRLHRRQGPAARRLQRRRDHEPDRAHAHAGSGDAAGRRRHGSLSVVVSDRRRWIARQRRAVPASGNARRRAVQRRRRPHRRLRSATCGRPARWGFRCASSRADARTS